MIRLEVGDERVEVHVVADVEADVHHPRKGRTHVVQRLGEGSGAALAVAVVKAAVACHNGMATFAEAGVAGKEA